MVTHNPKDRFGGSSLAGGGNKVRELKDVIQGKKDNPPGLPPESGEAVAESPNLAAEQEKLVLKIAELEGELAEAKDQRVRILAESENFRKRMEKEKNELVKYSNAKLLNDLLPVIDHLEMSLAHANEAPREKTGEVSADSESFVEGVQMVLKQFTGVLDKFGVHVVTGEGLPFDPHRQECIGQEESDSIKDDHVVRVHRKGYYLNDRLLRPALVTISRPKPSDTDNDSNEPILH